MTSTATLALAVFVITFTVATLRGVHLGLLMLVAAASVGPTVAGMTMREVIAGFPVSILVLVAGVSFFFGTATLNGTIHRVLDVMLARTRGLVSVVPAGFFGLAAVMAAMGSPQAGLATGPMGMSAVRQARVDPVLMAIALNGGISAGSFAPTSLFGVITHQVAQQAGINVNVFVLLAVAIVANIVTVAVAALLLRAAPDAATGATTGTHTAPVQSASRHAVVVRTSLAQTTDVAPFGLHQWATVACLVVLAVTVAGGAAAGVDLDIGMLLLGLGAVLALLDPATGARAFARIDWSTAFIVGGIVTYVGVLQKLDAVTQLGRAAMAVGSPIVAALLVCTIAALVSAVASTTAVLAALVPMAVPLATSGAVPGWALITALGVSATIVDGSPFSNTGATLIAAAAESDRPRLRTMLLRWSMAMVVAGPLVVLPVLLALARWGG